LTAEAQPYKLTPIPLEDHVATRGIIHITKDSLGYLWLSTQNGLGRYDGNTLKMYTNVPGDTTSLHSNYVFYTRFLTQDKIFLSTIFGGSIFDRRTGTFQKIHLPKPAVDEVLHIHYALENPQIAGQYILLSSHGVFTANLLDEQLKAVHCPELSISPGSLFHEDDDHFLYFNNDNISRIDYKTLKIVESFPWPATEEGSKAIVDPTYIAYLEKEELFVVSNNSGEISILNKGFEYLQSYPTEHYASLGELTVVNGKLWMGSASGTLQLNAETRTWDTQISLKRAFSIYPENNGNIWMSTSEGFSVLTPNARAFKNIKQPIGKSSGSNMMWCITELEDQSILSGSHGGLFHVPSIEANHATLNFLNVPGYGYNIPGVMPYEDKFLLAAVDRLLLFDTTSVSSTEFPLDTEEASFFDMDLHYQIVQRTDTTAWLANRNSVFPFDLKTGKWITENVPKYDRFEAYVAKDHKGNFWMAGKTSLGKIAPDQSITYYDSLWQTISPEKLHAVMSVAVTKSGIVLIGTTVGVYAVDIENNSIRQFTENDGLPNSRINGILVDAKDRWWASTDAGLACYLPEQDRFVVFNTSNGLPYNEFSQMAFLNHSSGNLLFGSADGLLVFHPDSIVLKEKAPSVILTDIVINYSSALTDTSRHWGAEVHYLSNFKLEPDENRVGFGFTSLDDKNTNTIQYSYRLLGYDSTWITAGNGEQMAYFTSLPPGDYQFEARSAFKFGGWGAPASLRFSVLPHFTQTWWFFLLVALAVLLLVVGSTYTVFKYRYNKQLRIAKERERIQKERERISMDLHDHVGAQFTQIILGLDTLSMGLSKKQDVLSDKAEHIGDVARGGMAQLREAVWALQQNEFVVQDVVNKLKTHIQTLNTVSQQTIAVEWNSEGTKEVLPPNLVLQVYRIVQEATSNVWKYSQANNLSIALVCTATTLNVKVEDDGIGFDLETAEAKEGHHGLNNMRHRTETLGGKFQCTSSIGKGTCIALWFDLEGASPN